MGIEPMHAGATIQCVNRFTKAAMIKIPYREKLATPYPPSPSPDKYFRRMSA